jgi:hypothetical protein
MSQPFFHFTMVFIDKVAANVGTLRMTFSRRVTVVTDKPSKSINHTGRPLVGFPAGGFVIPTSQSEPNATNSSKAGSAYLIFIRADEERIFLFWIAPPFGKVRQADLRIVLSACIG